MQALAMFFLQNEIDQAQINQIQHIMAVVMPLIFIFILIGMAIIIVPTWFICKKAGFSPWLSMICLVPTVGLLILLYVLAFADWKVTPAPPLGFAPPQPPYPPYPPQGPTTPRA
ncbi:MAG: hypothetical protein ACLGSD_18790 [Acidobacteriota bacterium]